MRHVASVFVLLSALAAVLAQPTLKQQILPPSSVGTPTDSTLFGSSFYHTIDSERLISVGFVQSDGSAYALAFLKNASGYFEGDVSPMFRGTSNSVTIGFPGSFVETTSYISEDGLYAVWGFYDTANDETGVAYFFHRATTSDEFQFTQEFSDPSPVLGRAWARSIAVSRDKSTLAIASTSSNEADRTIELYGFSEIGPTYSDLGTILGNDTFSTATWGKYIALSPDGRWLAIGNPGGRTYYIYDLAEIELSFTGGTTGEDNMTEWSTFAFNDDPGNLRLAVGADINDPENQIVVRLLFSSWSDIPAVYLNNTNSPVRQCKSISLCSNGRSLFCGDGDTEPTSTVWMQNSPFDSSSLWTMNASLVGPDVGVSALTYGYTPSSPTTLSGDGVNAVVGWPGTILDGYGGSLFYFTNLPPCVQPTPCTTNCDCNSGDSQCSTCSNGVCVDTVTCSTTPVFQVCNNYDVGGCAAPSFECSSDAECYVDSTSCRKCVNTMCVVAAVCSTGFSCGIGECACTSDAPPVEPPTAPPTEPPTGTPVDPPSEPPVSPPISPPVTPPTAVPVSPPVVAPVAHPTAAPINPPTQPPESAPTQPPDASPEVTPTTIQPWMLPALAPKMPPINETVTPAMADRQTIAIASYAAGVGLVVLVVIIFLIACRFG